MSTRKENFLNYLRENANQYLNGPTESWLQDVLEGNFNSLPKNPFDMDWQVFALLINGYQLSRKLGLGETLEFVKYCLKRYRISGELPQKSIELWVCLFGIQREEHFTGYPIELDEECAQFLIEIFSRLRTNLSSEDGVIKLCNSFHTTPEKRYKNELIYRYWMYQNKHFTPAHEYFDQVNNDFRRPPVFLPEKMQHNILTQPESTVQYNKRLFNLIPMGEHHYRYNSMNSSQALALSVLGNLFLENQLSILHRLHDDEGESLILNQPIRYDTLSFEHKVDYLGERRNTSIDAFIPGKSQIAIECKFTEKEVGSCSRPRMAKSNPKYEQLHCEGSYIRRKDHEERCVLAESGIKYWEFIPFFFNWDVHRDEEKCKIRFTYQLVRNILAAGCGKDLTPSPRSGQVILIYDSRNPECQHGGKIYKSYCETKEALLNPKMLKKISWQSIVRQMRLENILPWLTLQLREKYGF